MLSIVVAVGVYVSVHLKHTVSVYPSKSISDAKTFLFVPSHATLLGDIDDPQVFSSKVQELIEQTPTV